MLIDLENLDCDIEYEYYPECIGGSYSDTGEVEKLPAYIELKSVKCKEIELITLLNNYQINQIEEKILREIINR